MNFSKRRSLFAFATLLLAGAVAPAGTPPAPLFEAPAAFKNAPAARPGTARPPGGGADAAWWKIFADPALDALEESGARANQDVAQAVARIGEARQQARIAAAGFFPHARLDLQANRVRTTNTGPIQKAQLVGDGAAFGVPAGGPAPAFASRMAANTYDDFQTPLRVSYELDIFGRVRHAYGSAHAGLQAAEADRRAVSLSLSAEIATQYFALRALDSEVAVLRRAVALRRDAIHLNQERVEAGMTNAVDLSRARLELANTEADQEEAVRLREEGENNLAALCGKTASDFRVPPRPLDALPPPVVPPAVPSLLLAQRPDLEEAGRRLAVAGEEIGVARARLLPTFNIEGAAGFESGDTSRLLEKQSQAFAVMGTISIPIFEGGRNAANLKAARARREEALAAYRATAITAFKEVENALAQLRRRASQLEARDRAEASAREVLGLSQKRYIEGAVDYFDVVDAQRSLLNAEISRVQTLNARFAATVALVRALGGEWRATR